MTTSASVIVSCKEDQKAGANASSTQAGSKQADNTAQERVAHVPVGTFDSGSRPGEPGRDPELEPGQRAVNLGPFRIDVRPYPGDPGKPARVGVSATEAQALCASQGGRLCTELEWERACRGPDSSIYPSGKTPCPPGGVCESEFEIQNMTELVEWTASKFGEGSDHKGEPVTRGASAGAAPLHRRCSRRAPAEKGQDVGFRCCYGAPNAASQTEPTLGPAYEERELTKPELIELLKLDERTSKLAEDASVFPPEAARTVLSRGEGEMMGFTLTTQALLWQPSRGIRYLVFAGRSGDSTSYVLAYALMGDKKLLAGSFIMENEPGPIALGYAESIRPRVHFSGCWGCPGETGKVLFRKPEELVMLQP